MTSPRYVLTVILANLLLCGSLIAQQTSAQPTTIVPRLVNFSGRAMDPQGRVITGAAGITFAIYNQQYAGSPLWLETQNVTADSKGSYTVQLGATKGEGLPLGLFSSGEARWLGVRVNGGEEQARVLLLSVPYALKAADAETVGGLPPSAFVMATPTVGSAPSLLRSDAGSNAANIGGGGIQNYLPIWTESANLGNSILYQLGSGSSGKIGINLTNPLFTLDVNGSELMRGIFEMATMNFATPTKGYNSQPLNLESSAYNSGTAKYTLNHFQWQAEPVGNNTTSPGATLNLLYGTDPNPATETGLKLSNKGLFTFATGQTFPGAGTVTSVGLSAPSSDFNVGGSPITKSGTLGLSWKVAPTSVNTANAIVKRDATGSFNAAQIVGSTAASTAAVNGINSNDSAFAPGVEGDSLSGLGVYGFSPDNIGVFGNGAYIGVNGATLDGYGVWGDSGTFWGVYGHSSSGQGIVGESGANTGTGFGPDGIDGISHYAGGSGLAGFNDTTGEGLYAFSNGGFAGFFVGDVDVDGNLSKASGSFKIDHPLDPANKYLYHSFVESPDMMNIYNGNVVTDADGNATVTMADWFETLNRDFRYQLTVIGQFAQAIVAQELVNRQFTIRTDKPNVKVSWQITGIRQDVWANAHRIPVEQEKPQGERGLYLHPELFGAPAEKSIAARKYPIVQKMLKEKASKSASLAKQ
jgi:hypothetical protein